MRIASDEDRPSSGRGRARHRVACPTNHKPHLFQIPPPAHALAADHPDPTPVPEFTRSDALDLNEKYCVRLLVRAVRGGARPDDCARSAAGIHLRDRTSRAEALLRILRQRSSPEAFAIDDEGNVAGHPALAREIDEYAQDLLAGESATAGATLVRGDGSTTKSSTISKRLRRWTKTSPLTALLLGRLGRCVEAQER